MTDTRLPYKRRLTKQRKLILSILKKENSPPNVEQIYKKAKKILHNISLATIYRNLNFLVKIGLIKKLNLQKQENRYDVQGKIHDYFICNICKNIYNILKYPLEDKHIKKFGNYDIGGFNLEYFGICPKCQNKKPCLKIININ